MACASGGASGAAGGPCVDDDEIGSVAASRLSVAPSPADSTMPSLPTSVGLFSPTGTVPYGAGEPARTCSRAANRSRT